MLDESSVQVFLDTLVQIRVHRLSIAFCTRRITAIWFDTTCPLARDFGAAGKATMTELWNAKLAA
jgi:hypothetical protein